MIPLLAQAAPPDSTVQYLVVGMFVLGLSAVLQLALTAKQLFGGNKGERQIEPTQLASLQQQFERYHQENKNELKSQTATLNKLDRESGETKIAVEAVKGEVANLRKIQVDENEKMFRRINAISTESTETRTRVDGLEKREGRS